MAVSPRLQGGNKILPERRPRRRLRSPYFIVAIAALRFAVLGCAGITSPDGWAGPHLEDDVLYLTPDSGEIAAVDPEDFSVRWLFPATSEVVCGEPPQARERDLKGIYGTPVLDDESVYIAGYDGWVYSLDRDDGRCNWAFDSGDPIVGGLTLVDGVLYFGSDNGLFFALSAEDAEVLRAFDTGDRIWATPLYEDGVLYVPNLDGQVWAFEAETFDLAWVEPFKVKGGLLTDPILVGDTLIVGGVGERLYGIDPETGLEKWESAFKAGNWFWGTPLVDEENEVIYAPNLDSSVYALTFDGQQLWRFEADNPVRSTPILIGDTLMVIDRKGNAYGVDPETGAGRWPAPAELKDTVLSNPMPYEEGILIVAQGGDIFQLNADGSGLRKIEVRTG